MKLTPTHREILRALRQRNMSRRDLEEATGRRSGCVCARVAELEMGGQVEPRGTKVCPYTGRSVEVLRLKRKSAKRAAA